MQEYVHRRFPGRARDLHVWGPVAEGLVGGDGLGEHGKVDLGEEGSFRFRDLGGGRREQPGARLAVGAHEALRHVGP